MLRADAHIGGIVFTHNRHFLYPQVKQGSFKLINGSLKQVSECTGGLWQTMSTQFQWDGISCYPAPAWRKTSSKSKRATTTPSVTCSDEGHRITAARLPVPLPGTCFAPLVPRASAKPFGSLSHASAQQREPPCFHKSSRALELKPASIEVKIPAVCCSSEGAGVHLLLPHQPGGNTLTGRC